MYEVPFMGTVCGLITVLIVGGRPEGSGTVWVDGGSQAAECRIKD